MARKFELTPPWITYFHEVEILFGEDPDVTVRYDEDSFVLRVFVKGDEKADALTQLLPLYKDFGNVRLTIEVIPANVEGEKKITLFQTAFEGNPVFRYAKSIEGVFTNNIHYVVFKNKVVQFFNDALDDVNGNMTTLYENVARDVFGDQNGIFFCTDVPEGDTNIDWP